ncbi:MAG: hypothetical protein KBH56_05175, partial [Enterococcus sp.]|nr:hypothetical protein [Enterococcus sp.]MBP9521342.1 hypothetical protein [Enterococcus sp.]
VPVIFIYNHQDEIIGKLSINEWKAQKKAAQLLNELEIKLYREAINYYTSNDFDKAEDILLFLILQTDYTHYEYVERLANLYRRNQRHSKEKELLLKARKNMLAFEATEGIIRRIDKRLLRHETSDHTASHSYLLQ